MRILLVSFFFFALSVNMIAQAMIIPLDGSSVLYSNNSKIEGSPYQFDDFILGNLIDTDGKIAKDVLLNYEAENYFFVAKIDDESYLQLNAYMYERVDLGKDQFQNLAVYSSPGYARIIYDGVKFKLFEKTIAHRSRTDSNKYNQIKSYYKIRKTIQHLLLVDDKLIEIKRKEKDLSQYISKKELKSYIKENKLKLKNDQDISNVLYHFDKQN